MKLIKIIIIIIIIFFALLLWLIKQSAKPTGFIGKYMINLWNKVYTPLFTWIITSNTIEENDVILDIGVGGGISTNMLANKIETGKIIGIDYSNTALQSAKLNNKKNIKERKVDIILADVGKLPFESNTFNLITAFQTHFHWKNFNESLHEIHRVMKANGKLILACEISKIDYYMKDFLDETYAKKYFEKLDFKDIYITKKDKWISFTMKGT